MCPTRCNVQILDRKKNKLWKTTFGLYRVACWLSSWLGWPIRSDSDSFSHLRLSKLTLSRFLLAKVRTKKYLPPGLLQSGTRHSTTRLNATKGEGCHGAPVLVRTSFPGCKRWRVWWVAAYMTDCWLWESFTVSRNKQLVTLWLLHALIRSAQRRERETVLSIKNLPVPTPIFFILILFGQRLHAFLCSWHWV